MLRTAITIMITLATSLSAMSQVRQVDSLLTELANYPSTDTHRVVLLTALGFAYYSINPDKTEQYGREILYLSEKLGYDRGLASGHQLLGIAASIRGNYPTALESYLISLSIQRKIGFERGVAKNLNNLAGIYFFQQDLEKALHYNQQSLETLRGLNDSMGIANAYLSRGMMYAKMEQSEEAQDAYRAALEIYTTQQDSSRMASTYGEIGQMFARAGRRVTALRYYQEALNINRRMGDRQGAAVTLIRLGQVYIDANDLLSARQAVNEALALAQALQSKSQQMHSYFLLAEIDSLRGNYRQALDNYDRYMHLKDSLYNETRSEQLARLEVQYQSEQARKEAQLLKKEKELSDARLASHQATIRNQRLLFAGTTVLLTLLAIGIAILYRLYQGRLRVSEQLTKQKSEMQRQKEELEALNHTKDQWFSILGHDFRYPLHFLQHALSLINEGNLSEREQVMLTRELEQRARNAGNLLDNLLYWAQGQLEEISLNPTYLNLHELVEQSLHYLEHPAEKKGVVLSNKVPLTLRAWADTDTIQLVIRNLIENAIKFSFRGDVIRIKGEELAEVVQFTVEDHGIGMSEEMQARLFQTDHPYSSVGTGRERGTGIGLILCRDIVARNAGTIQVSSQPGKGSKLIVMLPRTEQSLRQTLTESTSHQKSE